MLKCILFITLFLFSLVLGAQNLVTNGSFEELTMCLDQCQNNPLEPNTIAVGWKTATSQTPDIYSPCNLGAVPISSCSTYYSPSNWQGYQFAFDGINYAGYFVGGISSDSLVGENFTDYISNKLEQKLEKKNYCVSYHIAAGSPLYYKQISQQDYYLYAVTNKTGVYFSNTNPYEATYGIYPHEPQVWLESDSSEYLNDTSGWDKVVNYYQANGGEEYIVIGNFVPYDELIYHIETNIPIDSLGLYADGALCYQYIDDVQLIEIPELKINSDTIVYFGSTIQLSTSTLTEGYEWFEGDTFHSLGGGNAISVSPEITTTYYIKANQCKLITWDTVNVTVIPKPIIPVSVTFLNTITSTQFQIHYSGDFKPVLDVELFNSVGQLILQFQVSESTPISLENVSAGIYYCRLSKAGVPVMTGKVVKVN